jgi:3-oxoacyl-[acyl-carrier-protein] synthase III
VHNPKLRPDAPITDANAAYRAAWVANNAEAATAGGVPRDPFQVGADGKGYYNSIIAAGNSAQNAQNNPDAWKAVPTFYNDQAREAFDVQTQKMQEMSAQFSKDSGALYDDFSRFLGQQR